MLKSIRLKKHKRIKKKILGTSMRPRFSIMRSGKHIYGQIIDDSKGITITADSDLKIKSGTKTEKARITGENLAKKAVKLNIKKIVFDRGGFAYHGRVSALADGARKGGLKF